MFIPVVKPGNNWRWSQR